MTNLVTLAPLEARSLLDWKAVASGIPCDLAELSYLIPYVPGSRSAIVMGLAFDTLAYKGLEVIEGVQGLAKDRWFFN
jgi:hypothetical protein